MRGGDRDGNAAAGRGAARGGREDDHRRRRARDADRRSDGRDRAAKRAGPDGGSADGAAVSGEAPSTKIQAPEKSQAPNSNRRLAKSLLWCLMFGASLELGAWCFYPPRRSRIAAA